MVPQATMADPYKELNWLFGLYIREKYTQLSNISQAKGWYIKFLDETSAGYAELKSDPRFFLEKYWEADALIRFTNWLNKQGNYIKSKTRYTIYKLVRRVMDWAYELGITDHIVYHAAMYKGVTETNSRSSYSELEQEIVDVALNKWINHAKTVLGPYKKSGNGIPNNKQNYAPLYINGKDYSLKQASETFGLKRDIITNRRRMGWTPEQCVGIDPAPLFNNGESRFITVEGTSWPSISQAAKHYGVDPGTAAMRLRKGATPEQAFALEPIYCKKGQFESMLYDFEERFDCDPLKMLLADRINRSNPNIFSSQDLMAFFLKIGVWPFIDKRLILPLAAELCRLTGLNAESIASLTVDSYLLKHPLTNQPCIRYVKTRSASATSSEDKELHLALLEDNEYFVQDELQAKIQEIISLTLKLTSKIRPYAIGKTANKLFIYEYDAWFQPYEECKRVSHIIWGNGYKQEQEDNLYAINCDRWTTAFSKENNFTEILGKNFRFNLSRFRSTLINNMIKEGADIFDIQAAVGHGNVRTTANYLSEKELSPIFNKIVLPALEAIAKQKNDDLANNSNLDADENYNTGVTETLCGISCKNAFNPSPKVRELTGHIKGTICKYWNMCLLCEQSSITENSLPKIIAYKWKLEGFLSEGKSNMLGRQALYEEIIIVIDDIIAPDHNFPESVLKEAEYLASELDDEALDHLVYQGF